MSETATAAPEAASEAKPPAASEPKPHKERVVREPAAAPVVEAAGEAKIKRNYVWGVGRRKSSVARVRIAQGNGKIDINGRELNDYLPQD